MTLNGAIKQLHELRSAEDMPIYYKPAIAEVINVLLLDAREVKRGRWIKQMDELAFWYECSVCGDYPLKDAYGHESLSQFCPWCGADMRKGEEE